MISSQFPVPSSRFKTRCRIAGIFLFSTWSLELGTWNFIFAEESRFYQEVAIEPGDTWWSLSERYLKDPSRWPEIARHNKLPTSDPAMALPGQTLRIPVLLVKESLRSAKLMETQRLVELRRRESPLWKVASKNMDIWQDDGLRTGALSQARVRFAQGEDLVLGPQSFAVIRPERAGAQNIGEAALISGEIRSLGARVVTQSARITPKSKNVEYRARVREDLATVVEVYAGVADVQAQNQTVSVRQGFATEVPAGRPPGQAVPVPEVPNRVVIEKFWDSESVVTSTKTISDQGNFVLRGSALGWVMGSSRRGAGIMRRIPQVSLLRVQVAQSPEGVLLWDETATFEEPFDFGRTGLDDGLYVYRVSLRDRLGFEGPFGDWQKLALDRQAPFLDITEPEQEFSTIKKNSLVIQGRSEPGALIRLGATSADTDSQGYFSMETTLQLGENRMVIAAVDAAGNFQKKVLTIDYKEETASSTGLTPEESRKWRRIRGDSREDTQTQKIAKATVAAAATAVILGVVVFLLFAP
ncbi:MAG: LysM peptidoglycan-binding domain-containing protein [Elusimicrobia bacterium]|nr:LysM peptidoglycan-binding domain-containing protein [Elusimicrobiota bacterium]